MIGAIAGDIVGSVYEHHNHKSKDFPLFSAASHFTDDTVLTVALADAILHDSSYAHYLRHYYRLYPNAGYGSSFKAWAKADDGAPYNSWGNGAAMRVSPVGFAYKRLLSVLTVAEWAAAFTHNHPEGIKGAQATAAAIFQARQDTPKADIRHYITHTFGYDLSEPLDSIRDRYQFDVSCQGSVPQAIQAFLEADGFEDTLRNAVSIGGDSDTIACIAGGIAEAYYGVPDWIVEEVSGRLDDRLNGVVERFYRLVVGC